jgi:hypothetical protein
MDYGRCELCKAKYQLVEAKEMGGTRYNVLKCEKCGRKVIRRA